jgi:hypothetical protein
LINTDHCSASFNSLTITPGGSVNVLEIGRDTPGGLQAEYEVSTTAAPKIIPNTSLEIKAMRLLRGSGAVPNSNIVTLEVDFFKKNKAASARNITKKFILEAQFSGNNLEKCFSQLDGAVVSACTALGGTIQGADCIDTRLECEMRREYMKWKGQPGTQVICGDTYKLTQVVTTETSFSARTLTLPSSFLAGTFSANILGAGGGGGCGCADNGNGGRGGSERSTISTQTDSLNPGSVITYRRGRGGSGGRRSGCRWHMRNGAAGSTSYIRFNSTNIIAAAGAGGRARSNGHGSGYDSEFMNTIYPGARYRANNHGWSGATGSGGAGGEKTAISCRSGGAGGHGVVRMQYKTFEQI